jgi:uncharacterized protein YwgA
MSEPEDIIAAVLGAAGGTVIGRVRLQKAVYLMDRLGFSSGFFFEYYHYGPYSRDIDDAVSDAKAFELVEEEIHYRQTDGATYSVFRLKTDPKSDTYNSLGREEASKLLHTFANTNITVLELAATIDWLWHSEKIEDWRREVAKRKGAKVNGGRLEKAVQLLEGLSLRPPETGATF